MEIETVLGHTLLGHFHGRDQQKNELGCHYLWQTSNDAFYFVGVRPISRKEALANKRNQNRRKPKYDYSNYRFPKESPRLTALFEELGKRGRLLGKDQADERTDFLYAYHGANVRASQTDQGGEITVTLNVEQQVKRKVDTRIVFRNLEMIIVAKTK